MSGYSDDIDCPNCYEEATLMGETRPFPTSYVECIECGFYSTVETGQMTRQEINEERVNRCLEPLGKDEDIKPLEEHLKYGMKWRENATKEEQPDVCKEVYEDEVMTYWKTDGEGNIIPKF